MAGWEQDIQEILIEADAIQDRVQALGRQISGDYGQATAPLVLVGILKGALFFMADLARAIACPVEIELMSVSSYGPSAQPSGAVRIVKDLDISIADRDVLIVEGIVDTGFSLSYLLRSLGARHPRSLRVCTLVDKPARRTVAIPVAYRGFTIPDAFVVGYGLDFDQRYRNLPYIGILKPACYAPEG